MQEQKNHQEELLPKNKKTTSTGKRGRRWAAGIRYTLYTFIDDSRSVGLLLILCTLCSLVVTNFTGQVAEEYVQFWLQEMTVVEHWQQRLQLHLPHSPVALINDLLMAVFFFLAGMEIKRETVQGELSSPKKAGLPMIAAVSGVALPALIFLLLNRGTGFEHGWGIPTATDIAFSLGVVALLGSRVPYSLKIFLTALAIIDDLCAILIIALFYGGQIQGYWLLLAAGCLLLLWAINRWLTGTLRHVFRVLVGLTLWLCVMQSGIHPTVAGILLAFMIPVSELPAYEHRVHLPVNFIIIPLFALANTCILLPDSMGSVMSSTVTWGILLGLFIGKPLGITMVCYMAVRAGWFNLPKGTNWKQFIGIGVLAGIGFTMSIFVTTLAYNDRILQTDAKIAILLASVLAIVVGYLWLYLAGKKRDLADS